jgi:hypothetical protein
MKKVHFGGWLAAVLAASFCSSSANAGGSLRLDPNVRGAYAELSCDNGRVYPLIARALTTEGDLITRYLQLSPRHQVHVRLVPMEHGYRYISRTVWFEGVRSTAALYLSKHRWVSCEVSYPDAVAPQS